MRWVLFATAMAASVTAGAGAAVLDIRPAHTSASADASSICEPITFNLYFERDQARLSEPAERMLDMVGGNVRGCTIETVSIDTPASDVASSEGRRVAGLRGAAVLKALNARGVAATSIVVTQSGSPNEPASVAPPHIAVAIEASKRPFPVDRGGPKAGEDV
jgi:hypothetical protein